MRLMPLRFFRASALPAMLGGLLFMLSGCSSLGAWTPDMFKTTTTASPLQSGSSGVQTKKERRFLGIFSPYRVDIQQGNFVSREMVAQVRENMKSKDGMTQEQVRFVMGTPLIMDIFHNDRWDYVFRLEKNNGDIITSDVTVYFENNRLKRLEGGDLPNEKDYLALIAGTPASPAAPATAATEKPVAPAAKQEPTK
jgi:outer membrane protein assembly factor BamE